MFQVEAPAYRAVDASMESLTPWQKFQLQGYMGVLLPGCRQLFYPKGDVRLGKYRVPNLEKLMQKRRKEKKMCGLERTTFNWIIVRVGSTLSFLSYTRRKPFYTNDGYLC